MPNITGTNNNDAIDVTNDSGTLNGSPQGTPIDDIRARGGNDTISVTDSTIANNVRGNGGSDDITIDGSTVSGSVQGGADADTVSIEGSTVGNVRLGSGDDTLDFISTSVTGDVRGGTGTDSLNLPVGTVVNDSTHGTFTVTSGGSYSLSSGTFTLPSGTTVTYSTFENGTGFPCFVRGTYIRTTKGLKRVEQLKVGDAVMTKERGPKKIRWVGQRKFEAEELLDNPKLYPVRIQAGALGSGLPRRDLLVSRQHRMFVRSKIAERMFGTSEVLVPAIRLVDLPGIYVDDSVSDVSYFHLLFDQHEIIYAEEAPTESLFTGPEALKSISREARREIFEIFPELLSLNHLPDTARFVPSNKLQKKLIERHSRNRKPLVASV